MNTTRHVWILSIVGLGIVMLFSSCASTTRGMMHSTRSFDDVFTACIQSTADVQFSVTSQDRTSGFIVADQAVALGGGSVTRMNITVKHASQGIEVEVVIVPPPTAVGDMQAIFTNYANAVKRRVPDITVY